MTGGKPPRRRASALARIGDHIGRRGAYLLFLSLLYVTVGYSLLQPLPLGLTREILYQPFTDVMPIVCWSSLWMIVGVLAFVGAFWQGSRPVMFSLSALVATAWSLGYLVGWWEGLPVYTRGYQTSAIFAAFAAVTLIVSGWRENDT